MPSGLVGEVAARVEVAFLPCREIQPRSVLARGIERNDDIVSGACFAYTSCSNRLPHARHSQDCDMSLAATINAQSDLDIGLFQDPDAVISRWQIFRKLPSIEDRLVRHWQVRPSTEFSVFRAAD